MPPQLLTFIPTGASAPSITGVSVLILCTLYVAYIRYFSSLAHIPGPLGASLSRLWITKHAWEGDMHRQMLDLHERYGKLVRTAPNEVSVSDLVAIKKIYGAGTKFKKSSWYSVFQGRRKFDLFAEPDERIHSAQRRLVSRIYAMESLKDLEKYVEDAVAHFMVKMDELQGQRVDMGNWIQLFAFDVIGELTFSKRFGFMDMGQDDGTFDQIKAALRSGSWLGQVPWLYWLHDFLMPVIGNHLGINIRHGRMRDFTVREIQNRNDRGSDHRDILGRLFEVQKEKPAEMDDIAVTSMAASNIFAGSDTTAVSIRAISYYLLKYPHFKARLVEEIDTRRREGRLSDVVRLDEAKDMPYLQAVMYEALRCHPAVGMSLPRVTPTGGIDVDGHFIPEGTIIGAYPWVVHRNREVFGDDATYFRPDRWLKDDTGDMERYFFAFGSGARMCMGRNISWMEMSKLVPTLLMHFDLQLADPEAEWSETCRFFVMQDGFNVMLKRRYVSETKG